MYVKRVRAGASVRQTRGLHFLSQLHHSEKETAGMVHHHRRVEHAAPRAESTMVTLCLRCDAPPRES